MRTQDLVVMIKILCDWEHDFENLVIASKGYQWIKYHWAPAPNDNQILTLGKAIPIYSSFHI